MGVGLQESLHGVVQPAHGELQLVGHLRRGLVDRRLRLEHHFHVPRRAALVEGQRDRGASDQVHLAGHPPAIERASQCAEVTDDLVAIHLQTRPNERAGTKMPRRRKAAGACASACTRKPLTSLTN